MKNEKNIEVFSYLKINDLGLEFEYSPIVCHSVEYRPMELCALQECHAKTDQNRKN